MEFRTILDILKEIYKEIIIPQAVFAEVTAKEDSVCRQVAGKEWIRVECVEDQSEKKMKDYAEEGGTDSLRII